MAQLEIYITVENGNTVSQYYTPKAQHVTFYNLADKPAEIVVKDPVGVPVLCEKQNDDATSEPSFTVPAQVNNQPGSVERFVCKSYEAKTFKYSAQVKDTNKEDPIILIGKDKSNPSIVANLPILTAGVALGIVLTLVALRLFRKQRPT